MADTATDTITLGGGCFWCIEAVFNRVEGVLAVESGYCNGHVIEPTYEQVCQGDSGHVEVVRVTYDPARIGLPEILAIFFTVHDPTTLNRQGNDIGPQYRSGIYWERPEQADVARAAIEEVGATLGSGRRVVTEVLSLANYHRAEDYHQRYFEQHPNQGYCAMVVAPKVDKFQRVFTARVRAA